MSFNACFLILLIMVNTKIEFEIQKLSLKYVF